MNCDSQISTLEVRLSLPKLLEHLASDSSKLSLSVEIPFSQKKLLLPMFYPIAGSSSYPMTGWYSIKILAPIQWNHVKECDTLFKRWLQLLSCSLTMCLCYFSHHQEVASILCPTKYERTLWQILTPNMALSSSIHQEDLQFMCYPLGTPNQDHFVITGMKILRETEKAEENLRLSVDSGDRECTFGHI